MIVTTFLNQYSDIANTQLNFILLNRNTNQKVILTANKIAVTAHPISKLKAGSDNAVMYSVGIPSDAPLKDSILLTSIKGDPSSATYFNGLPFFDFIAYDYTQDPLQGLKFVGLIFTILITIFIVVTKLKGHFMA